MFEDASPAPFGDRNDEASADDEGDDQPAVESLVTGRAKRATAGNRLSSLLEKEGDDELELLFADNEEDEDVEFEEEEEIASDADLDSSTDEDDQDAADNDDELVGERELQTQSKLERQKKRKAQDVFKRPGALHKKVKIDTSATISTPAPKPKKKSERVSWVHTEADAPIRASSRKQTVRNREVVHKRLVDSEQTRLKVMRQMEEAQKRKNARKPKALTQADRMEEATGTEKKNAKTLNRWEESEKKRTEEQRAKLEALHNRQLSGPVITWWSGLSRWVNGKIEQLGVKAIRNAGHIEAPTMKEDRQPGTSIEKPFDSFSNGFEDQEAAIPDVLHPHHLTEPSNQMTIPRGHQSSELHHVTFAPPQGPYGFLDGIHAYAALPMQQQHAEFTGTADDDSHLQSHSGPTSGGQYDPQPRTLVPAGNQTPQIEFASRTLVALKNIDANAVKLPEFQSSVLLKRPRAKLPSKSSAIRLLLSMKLTDPVEPAPELCAITMQPARFRDPTTSLAYANSYAYKEIHRLRYGGSRWSNLLDCYVGPVNSAAQGVPERFWIGS